MRISDLFEEAGSNLDAFISDLEKQTVTNPMNPRERVVVKSDNQSEPIGSIEVGKWNGAIHISSIVSVSHGQRSGNGSAIIKMLTELADKHSVIMTCLPNRIGDVGPNTTSLRSWYMRNGFVGKDNSDLMVREPRAGLQPPRIRLKMKSSDDRPH